MQNKIEKPSGTQAPFNIKQNDTIAFDAKASKLEKALRLGNDEVIARAVQDILKRDHIQAN